MNINNKSAIKDKEMYLKKIEQFEILKRLNETDDFNFFKKIYITERLEEATKVLNTSTLGTVMRQQAIEEIIGINNLKLFLDSIDEELTSYRNALKELNTEAPIDDEV